MKSINEKWKDLISEIEKLNDGEQRDLVVAMAKSLEKDINSLVVDVAVAGFGEYIDQSEG
jgi:excinuclease UvrABC helicase subunit UvrB